MLTGSDHIVDLWSEGNAPAIGPAPDERLLQQLREVAENGRDPAELSAVLYETLRKQAGRPEGREILAGIQYLASAGEGAGARLLAAMLEVAAPARRLLPRVRNMSSSRRLWLGRLKDDSSPGPVIADWTRRLHELSSACRKALAERGKLESVPAGRVGWEEPWGPMRAVVLKLVGYALGGGVLADGDRTMLADLLDLEIDAWQERISYLAGTIDPFRVVAISRVLPILSQADADIRDLRHLVQMIREKHDTDAFTRPRLRALEVLEDKELSVLNKVLADDPGLRPLAELFELQQVNPLPVSVLAYGVARIQTMSLLLKQQGLRESTLDLISACRLVVEAHARGEVALVVPREILVPVEAALQGARGMCGSGCGPEQWSLDGVEVLVGQLVVVLPEQDENFPPWRNFLPTPSDPDPLLVKPVAAKVPAREDARDEEDEAAQDVSASAMKNLVLTNIQSTSLILGFLRNPKFVAIPGLVEAVAARTRNPRVIETIAVDRTLHTGFANRGVPIACLRSPVNVSVKILRKFIHVKYVSKIDLKRMAQDRAGIRKEVIREIEKYLEALA